MQINFKIVSGILATIVVYDTVVGIVNSKRFDHNLSLNKKMRKRIEAQARMIRYLSTKLVENEIPCDDFDEIVIWTIKADG